MTQFRLAQKAIEYKTIGIITLPVDRNTKRALIPYADLSLENVTEDYIETHFGTESKADGIAILTGKQTGILSLDIDNPVFRTILREKHPDFLDTFTEKTPRQGGGYHLFYRIPDSDKLLIRGRKWQGIDLLYGNYALSAPTKGYRVIEDKPIKRLGLKDYVKLCQFFDTQLGMIDFSQNRELPRQSEINEESPNIIINETQSANHDPDVANNIKSILRAVYYTKRQKLERNQSLFNTACYARDNGYTKEATKEALVLDYILDTPHNKPIQNQESRRREAIRTIKSAYSRPPRSTIKSRGVLSLSDSTREKLFKAKMPHLVRTLEALYRAGYTAGESITRKEAIEILRTIVGRDSTIAALEAFFPLSAPIPPYTAVAKDKDKDIQKKCFFVRVQKSVKTYEGTQLGGRPKYEYTIPSPEQVAEMVDANDMTYSTPLTLFDLETAKKTRQKLHYSLIDRRPDQYDLIWLAKRLGVTENTIKTYNRDLNIYSELRFKEIRITQFNIDFIFEDLPQRKGVFIMGIFGKKYPPLVGIAQRLLTRKLPISLFIQQANYYSTKEPTIAPVSRPRHSKSSQNHETMQQKSASEVLAKQKELPALDIADNESRKPENDGLTDNLSKLKQWCEDVRFDDIYELARVDTWQGMTGIKPLRKPVSIPSQKQDIDTTSIRNLIQGLSERNTKRLIAQYGYKRVLFVSQGVSKRENVDNPAGLLTSILKSEASIAKDLLL